MTPELMLIALVGAHAFFDYAGQGDFMSKAKNRTMSKAKNRTMSKAKNRTMSKAKNRTAPIPTVPWWNILTAHSAIHGAAVALITGVWWLFILEAAIHFATDDAKCRGRISYNTDQAIHIACKLAWWLIAIGAA